VNSRTRPRQTAAMAILIGISLLAMGACELQGKSDAVFAPLKDQPESHRVRFAKGMPVPSSTAGLFSVADLDAFPSKTVVATGYTAGPESTGKSRSHPAYGITKSGVPVRRGVVSTIAADPDVFPIGTVLFVPDYGYAVVADTGSAIKGDRIDLYFSTVSEVYRKWGKRKIRVYVIESGDGVLDWSRFDELTLRFGGIRKEAA
jgi:3D (Asp-Asp-Asp) domain-containing protein